MVYVGGDERQPVRYAGGGWEGRGGARRMAGGVAALRGGRRNWCVAGRRVTRLRAYGALLAGCAPAQAFSGWRIFAMAAFCAAAPARSLAYRAASAAPALRGISRASHL